MARARSEPPPPPRKSEYTTLSESWDYLCGTSLHDGRFLAIYWPWERSRTKSRIDFEQHLKLALSLRTGERYRNTRTYIFFPRDKSLPSSIDQEKFNVSSNSLRNFKLKIPKMNERSWIMKIKAKKNSKSLIIDQSLIIRPFSLPRIVVYAIIYLVN